MNCGLSLFWGNFGRLGSFYQVGLKKENQLAQTNLGCQPRSNVLSFYVWTQFTSKIRVTAAYLLQSKKISSFIYSFRREIYSKLKKTYRQKPPLISKDFIFDSFTLAYIRLHLSTLVYTRFVTRLCF